MLSITSLIDNSFFIASINVITDLLVPLFIPSTWINSLFLTRALITLLNMTRPSQVTLPHLFINRGYPIFKQISLFWILSFHVFPFIYLNVLILITLSL